MSWSLFLDEPIDPRGDNPYRVVAGLAIEDRHIWPLTVRLADANLHYFGQQLRASNSAYVKGVELLNQEIFFEAQTDIRVSNAERTRLIFEALNGIVGLSSAQGTALAQAKILYCRFIVNLIRDYDVRAFAVMAPSSAEPATLSNQLRRDYALILERYFYFVDDHSTPSTGFIVLSDLNKYGATANNISDYFLKTKNGKLRSRAIMPEPLFARGRINILFQATSLLAYTLSWTFRTPAMDKPIRPELNDFAVMFRAMRYLHTSSEGKKNWSFKYLNDLSFTLS